MVPEDAVEIESSTLFFRLRAVMAQANNGCKQRH